MLCCVEEDTRVWDRCSYPKDDVNCYQCRGIPSLFKKVYADGTVKYSDVDRIKCSNVHDSNRHLFWGLILSIIDEMVPITMPYIPGKPIEVYYEDFLTEEKDGNYRNIGIFYALKNENGESEKIEINRFFKESDDDGGWTEISREDYDEQKIRRDLFGFLKGSGADLDGDIVTVNGVRYYVNALNGILKKL